MSNNGTVTAKLKNLGETVFLGMCKLAKEIGGCQASQDVHLGKVYYERNIMADQVSCKDQLIPVEWSFLPWVFDNICKAFGFPHVDLFTTRVNTKLARLHVSSPGSHVIEAGCPTAPVGQSVCSFPPFTLQQVLSRVLMLENFSMVLVAPLWPQKVILRPSGSSGKRTS